jgi:cyclic beta-1,2-glucan synthetase
LRPCIPAAWPGFRLSYRLPGGRGRLAVEVRNAGGGPAVVSASLDGHPLAVGGGAVRIPLPRDGKEHRVDVVMG